MKYLYETANVLICDPIGANRAATRTALFSIGFRRIELSSSVASFGADLLRYAPDLALCECQGAEEELFSLIQAIRQGSSHHNPFTPIILTSWEKTLGLVRRAIDSGADDFLLRPLTTEILAQRIAALVERRKGFVISSDYVGPDRRSGQTRTSANLFVPPNSLKLKVKDRVPPEEVAFLLEAELKPARQRLQEQKSCCDALQLAIQLKMLQQHGAAGRGEGLRKLTSVALLIESRALLTNNEAASDHARQFRLGVESIAQNAASPALQSLPETAWQLYRLFDRSRTREEFENEVSARIALIGARERAVDPA
jgi:DNA-binding response OmpR family regulator